MKFEVRGQKFGLDKDAIKLEVRSQKLEVRNVADSA